MSVISANAPHYRDIPYKISILPDGVCLWRTFPPKTVGLSKARNGRCYSEAEAHRALRLAIDEALAPQSA